ncbi:MAG: hypothetical protein HN764_16475 [Gammaproteobacteria bacterium]|jgi:hypothetical protein|nr:hypothetical protein [Gammaproteobacteria bacterium]
MTKQSILNEKTLTIVSDYFGRNELRSMTIKKGMGITKNTEISDVDLIFIKDQENQDLDYSVKFKLQTVCADLFRYIKAINTSPGFSVELADGSENIKEDILNDKLMALIEIIRDRVKSAQKEQKVQSISFVGNTFILNNSTKFKVLSDDGEGRLNIEILSKDLPMDALLTASGLLDGLYLGSIKLAES